MTARSYKHPAHILILFLLSFPISWLATCAAKAAPACRICAPRAVAAVHHQAAVVAAPVYSTPYYAEVGAQLQQEAAATYAFRGSREYDELLELRGYVRAVQERNAADAAQSPPATDAAQSPPATETPAAPAYSPDDVEPAAEPEPLGDESLTASDYEAAMPTVAAKCTSCHLNDGANDARKHLSLAAPLTFDQRLAMAFSVHEGTMPKNGTELSPEEKQLIYRELFPEQ